MKVVLLVQEVLEVRQCLKVVRLVQLGLEVLVDQQCLKEHPVVQEDLLC